MPKLGDATAIKLGSTTVTKAYLGSTQVWPTGAPPAAPTVIESKTQVMTATNGVTVTFTTSPIAGDLVFIFTSIAPAATRHASFAPGWTSPLPSPYMQATDSTVGVLIAYRAVTSGEDTANTVTFTANPLYATTETGEVIACYVRGANATLDAIAAAEDVLGTASPHVFPAIASGDVSSTNGLVLRFVAKQGTGTWTTPAGHTLIATSTTNRAVWLGSRDTLTTSGVAVAATNITPNVGDEAITVTLVLAPV